MSNENLKISLSAVMDNAADELELRRVLANADDSVMATWSRYQIARSVIRKEVVFPKIDIASAVSHAIAEEEVSDSQREIVSTVKPQNNRTNLWAHVGKFAVAASILAVTLSSVYFFNNDEVMSSDSVAQSSQASDDMSVAVNDQWIEQRLSNFVDRHEQQGVLTIDNYDQTVNSSNTLTN